MSHPPRDTRRGATAAPSAQQAAELRSGLVVSAHGRHVVVEDDADQRWRCHARGKKSDLVGGDWADWAPSDNEGVVQAAERGDIAPSRWRIYGELWEELRA